MCGHFEGTPFKDWVDEQKGIHQEKLASCCLPVCLFGGESTEAAAFGESWFAPGPGCLNDTNTRFKTTSVLNPICFHLKGPAVASPRFFPTQEDIKGRVLQGFGPPVASVLNFFRTQKGYAQKKNTPGVESPPPP